MIFSAHLVIRMRTKRFRIRWPVAGTKRGRSTTWTRIRVNLENVPPELRPDQEPLDPDYDPWAGVDWPGKPGAGEAARANADAAE